MPPTILLCVAFAVSLFYFRIGTVCATYNERRNDDDNAESDSRHPELASGGPVDVYRPNNVTDARPGFCLGTVPYQADIALDGVATALGNDSMNPFTVPEGNQTATLYIMLNEVYGFSDEVFYDVGARGQSGEIAYFYAHGATTTDLYAGAGPRSFYVEFTCNLDGFLLVTVTVRLIDLPSQEPYKDVVFYLRKECRRPAFDVSATIGGSQAITRIAINSQANESFVSPTTSTSDTLLIGLNKNSSVMQHKFYLEWSSRNMGAMIITPSNGLINGVGDSAAMRLNITYNCWPNQASNSTVNLYLGYWWVGEIALSFTKQCNTIQPLSSRTGLYIGSRPFRGDVVFDGQETVQFSDPNHPFTVPEVNQSYSLYLNLRSVPGFPNNLFYNSSVIVGGNNVAMVGKSGWLTGMLYAGTEIQQITLDFLCAREGMQSITLKLDLYDQPYQPAYKQLVIYLEKQCQRPSFDVSGFVEDSQFPSPMIENMQAIGRFVSPAKSLSDIFLIGLNNASAVHQHAVRIIVFMTNTSLVTVNAAPTSGFIDGADTSAALRIQFNYTCAANQSSSNVLKFELDYGWESSLIVNYTKLCDNLAPTTTPAPPSKPGDDSTGANTPVIIGFSAVIAVLAFFLLGSLYNYCIQKQRGWDIVPGITFCRRCCGCFGGRSPAGTESDDQYAAIHDKGGINI